MSHAHSASADNHHQADVADIFGFWLYIMTDCILFGCLFVVYVVMAIQDHSTIHLKSYLNLYDILIETFCLLFSNFCFCLSILNIYKDKVGQCRLWLALTFLLGLAFMFLEIREFQHLAAEGFRWDYSGHASAFFTLVGTHGLHVSCGLAWILLLIFQMPVLKSSITKRRMTYLGLFWNFLDIIWIFVFSIVYLLGAS